MNPMSAAGLPAAPGERVLSGLPQSKDSPPREPGGGAAAPPKRRAAFFIDGFNLYHALKGLGDRHLRWLNLRDLANTLINHSEAEVVRIVWCSAEYRKTFEKQQLHRAYVKALRSVGVVPILGHFVPETLRCRADCGKQYVKDTEKASDVNVGVYLIGDGFEDKYDDCFLISADSDQSGTINFFEQRLLAKGKRITIVAPPGHEHSYSLINRPNVFLKSIKREAVERCLFPKDVRFSDGSACVERPSKYDPRLGWKRPEQPQLVESKPLEVIKPASRGSKPVIVERKKSRIPKEKK